MKFIPHVIKDKEFSIIIYETDRPTARIQVVEKMEEEEDKEVEIFMNPEQMKELIKILEIFT